MNNISIGIHLDSLGEAYNFPPNFLDPTFFSVMDRFLEIAERRNFPYTIYVIGKDLTRGAHAAQVKFWHNSGHEIANHSWSHHVDLSLLSPIEVHDQISNAHNIIAESTGKVPKGFVAPGWAFSDVVFEELISLGYLYDTSVFPSWVMIPQYIFWMMNFIGSPKLRRFFRRGRDVLNSVFAPRDPFVYCSKKGAGSLKVLPLPATKSKIACWHSLGFVIGWNNLFKLIRSSLKKSKAFYYLMHAGDLLDSKDMDYRFPAGTMPRAKVPIAVKINAFERLLDIFEENEREIVTTRELADNYFAH